MAPSSKPQHYHTEPDEFGLYRVYPVRPQRLPDEPTLDAVCEGSTHSRPTSATATSAHAPSGLAHTTGSDRPPFAPFRNFSTFAFTYWQNNETNLKSNEQMGTLAEIIQHPAFRPEDVAGFNAAREAERLDSYYEESVTSPLSPHDGWQESSVKIRVPKEGVSYVSEEDAPEFTVEGVYHRSLVDIVDAAYRGPDVKSWHIVPSRLYHLPADACMGDDNNDDSTRTGSDSGRTSPSTASSNSQATSEDSNSENPLGGARVYNEAYHADAIWEEDAAMRAQAREAGDPEDLEYGIAPIGLYSDSTHLTSFGSAKLWPGYAYLLSQSKYVRGKPTAFAAHHLVYIPSLPDKIQDWYTRMYNIAATAAVLTFLKRELMQQVWLLIMDDRFMYAYIHGLIIACGDGVLRRLFIRFLLYAADYPEKILLACLKYFARCPCPRCRINKDKIIEMGTANDTSRRRWTRMDNDDLNHRINLARKFIFERGVALTSLYISRIMDPLSITPTRSAFSVRLREHGFNFYSLFVPDLLHEFELGVWKSIFTHLLRLLYAVGNDVIQEFNKRFRQIPTYGRSTIRKFSTNVSDQGKLAARDYEARLKCIMPTIEALIPLPTDDKIVLDLAFDAATWHALAKLREHVDSTLDGLDFFTIEVGKSVRNFSKKTCTNWVTVELPKEAAARGRRTAARTGTTSLKTRKLKTFNCTTYKFHAMADYPSAIRTVGSTDNYNTQVGELEHRHAKRFYVRTNRIKFARQIARHARRAQKLQVIKARVDAAYRSKHPRAGRRQPTHVSATQAGPSVHATENERSHAYPTEHHHVGESKRDNVEITAWLREHRKDPALTNFIPKLKDHLLGRRTRNEGRDIPPGGYTTGDRAHLVLINNKIYWHQVLRVNYTTYDRRRSEDSINPRTHSDILLLAPPGELHPYWYARVLKIFHVNCRIGGGASVDSEIERADVVFVRWFRLDTTALGGFSKKRLHRLEFVPETDPTDEAFGFVNPADVVRCAHLIPAFTYGRTRNLLSRSLARNGAGASEIAEEQDTDFRFYYVNVFVDRDMFMRYWGGGIGHQGLRLGSKAALDDNEFDSEWQDIDEPQHVSGDSDCGSEDGDDQVGPSDDLVLDPLEEVIGEDALLRLIPELGEDGELYSHADLLGAEEGDAENDNLVDSDTDSLVEDADIAAENEPLGVDDGEDGEVDEYALEGFAPL
ncbi:hypothetical protein C8Q78DRAFT_971002 [Trametes maxima]|nr:hypothetical protein C8Q78DRAFT_971002 [Trametes maxima]